MNPATFDKSQVFLSDTSKLVSDTHQLSGGFGSSLLSLRSDLKTFCEGVKALACDMSLTVLPLGCKEQYVVRLKNHTLKVTVTSHKATAPMLARKTPDTALKIQRMLESIRINVDTPYAEKAQAFVLSAFKRNAETCTFQADSHFDEWSLVFQDAKHRTYAEIDLYESEEYTEVVEAIIPILPVTKSKAKKKVPAALLTA